MHIFYLLISNLGHSYLSRVTPGRFVTLITIPLFVLIHEVIKHKHYDCQYDKLSIPHHYISHRSCRKKLRINDC